jgi:mannonate dehydratase
MDLSLILPRHETERWDLARQMGVGSAVSTIPERNGEQDRSFEALLSLRNRFADAGLSLDVIESRPPLDRAMLDREGGAEEIEATKEFVRNMGRAGIDVWCYVWMAPLKVLRTSESVRGRGGSLVTEYDHAQMQRGPRVAGVDEDTLWRTLERFLAEVVPVAEEAGVKLALHPDDPPISPVRGAGRIVTSPEAYRRVLDLQDSAHNGITFCQGNFSAMGTDVPARIREFGDRIHFAHFRDVEGTPEHFTETWHDEGQTDMLEAMRAYRDVGFEGPCRPDHVPTMAGEDNARPGYEMKGRLWAIGYMRGLQQAVEDERGREASDPERERA